MITCPYCGAENLEGSDFCSECQLSLTDLSLPQPTSLVELGLLKDRIECLQPKTPLTVAPDLPVAEVLQKMVGESIGCVMVATGEELLGIFSEHDALMKLNVEASKFAERPIREFMTSDPITAESKDKIAFAVHKMHVGGYRHLPVMEEGKLVGVISIRDILNYLADRMTASASA